MRDKNFNNSILKAGAFLVISAVLFFSNFAPARAGFFDQVGSYFSEGGQTLGDAAGAVAKNTAQAGDAFFSGIKNFGQTVGGLGVQVSKGYDAVLGKVKQGTDKITEKAVNVLPKKESAKVVAPKPAVKNNNSKLNTASTVEQPAATEVKVLPTEPAVVKKEEKKKSSASVAAPKEIIIYSNKANQESVQPLVATAAKAVGSGNATFETVKSKGNVLVGNDVVIDAATGIATLKGLKIIGTVDFTGAEVKGFKQTVVNNYSSGGSTPLVVYNSSTKDYENRTSISGNYGGVSEHFSVGKDLTVSNAATIGAGGLTIGTASANGSLTVNGTASITGATTFSSALTLSSGATLSGDLTVNGNTTLGDAAGDSITINGRLSTLNISDGSTTSSLAKNSFYIAADSTNALGKFYVDSSGNVTASGTITSSGGITMSGHLAPSSDNLYDVGSSSTQWRYGNFQGGLLVADGSTTSTLLNNSLTIGQASDYNLGRFYINSSGNTSVSGTLNLSNTTLAVVSSTAANLRLAADGANELQLWTNAVKRFYINSSGNAFASGTLQVTNTSTLYNDLLVGASTESIADAGFIFNGNDFYVEDQFGVNGLAWFDGSIRASSTLLATGAATFYGNTTLGDAAGDTISLSGTVNTGILASSTLLIGTAAGTDNLFVSGNNTYVATSTAGGTAYSLIVGNGTTGAVLAGGHVAPSHTGLFDIGRLGQAFNNVYASSSLNVGSGANSSTFKGNYLATTDGTSSTVLNASSLTLGSGTSYNSGMFYVDSNGNVSASGTLGVTGVVNFTGASVTNTISGGLVVDTNTLVVDYAQGRVAIGAAGVDAFGKLAITAAGNTVPMMTVVDTQGSGATWYIDNGYHSSAAVASPGTFEFRNGTNAPVMFTTGNAIYLGVATNYNAGKFSINSSGNASATGTVTVWGGQTASSSILAHNALTLGSGTNYNSGMFYVGSSGNISASGTLALTNSSGSVVSSTGGNLRLAADGGNTMQFWTNNVQRMVLDSSGNIGLGTSTIAAGDRLTMVGGDLSIGNGSNTSTFSRNTLTFSKQTNFNQGSIWMGDGPDGPGQARGDISASGTLRIFGGTQTNPGGLAQGDNFGLQISATITAAAGTTSAASTTFNSYVVNGAGSTGFVFNTVPAGGAMTSGTDRMLAVFQNNGTNKVLISAGGNVYAKESFIANSTAYGIGDMAEYVNLAEGAVAEYGDVVVVDSNGLNQYRRSENAYAKNVAGVISDTGAFVIGASGEGRAPLALAGLVNVKVTDENGPIAVGDYLVTASKSGYAMKYDSSSGRAAGLVGMALEPLSAGDGKIKILVNKGLVAGNSGAAVNLSVGENNDGTLSSGENWDFGGKNILNVKSISAANGQWYIDEKGLLAAKEIKADKIQAKKFVVEKENDLKKASVGSATISHNNSSVAVENELITPKVKIFITFRSNPNSFWWISSQVDGKFEVALSKVAEGDLTFDYWIVGIEEALSAIETEVAPAAVPVVSVEEAPVAPVAPVIEQIPTAPAVSEPVISVVESAAIVPAADSSASDIVSPIVEPASESSAPAVEPVSAEPSPAVSP